MRKIKNCVSHKVMPMILVALMVMSVLPLSALSAFAATNESEDAVTITVKDESGIAVENASVDYVINSKINGDNYIAKKGTTDSNGCVTILSSEKYVENDLSVTAVVSKNGFKTDDKTIVNVKISSANQNIDVSLVSTQITDVSVIGSKFTFDNEWHNALSVTKREQDKVSYEYDSQNVKKLSNGVLQVKEAGTYNFKVTVIRDGYDPYVKNVEAIVEKADINDITISAKNLNYNENQQELVTVQGINEKTDTVSYTVNGEEVFVESGKVPTEDAIGNYTVKLKVDRGSNYNVFEKEVKTTIGKGIIDVDGLLVKGLESNYTGKAQQAVDVTGKSEKYTLKYKLGNDGEWSDDIPTVTNAGSYTVFVKATKNLYNDQDVPVKPAKSAVLPFNVFISKANQNISFKEEEYSDGQIKKVDLYSDSDKNNYTFSAVGGNTDAKIEYSVSDENVAEIDNEGSLTVKTVGLVVITAKKPGDNNYNEASIIYNLIVKDANSLVSFENSSIDYTFGENGCVVSSQKAIKNKEDDNGELTYSIDKTDIGLECDKDTGEIKITNYTKLSEELENNKKQLDVKVIVEKSEGTKTVSQKPEKTENMKTIYFTDTQNWGKANIYYWADGKEYPQWPGSKMDEVEMNPYNQKVYKLDVPSDVKGIVFNNGSDSEKTKDIDFDITDNRGFYPSYKNEKGVWEVVPYTKNYEETAVTVYDSATATYTVHITTAEIPENPYTLNGTKKNIDSNWYTSEVTVTAANGYKISTSSELSAFSENVVFSDEGKNERYVYLQNDKGGITSKIPLKFGIDTNAPDANNIWIDFSNVELIKKITDSFVFFKQEKLLENLTADITFIVKDEIGKEESGLDHINWCYEKVSDVKSIAGDTEGVIEKDKIKRIEENGEVCYSATLRLPVSEALQYRGKISFTATDVAGNKSDIKTEDRIIVVDTVNPKMSVSYEVNNAKDDHQIVQKQGKEHHYYSGDVKVTFNVTEANFFADDVKITVSKNGNTQEKISPEWKNSHEKHTASFTISGDGDYQVSMKYSDSSGNIMTDSDGNELNPYYESEVFTIDTTPAVVESSFEKGNQQTTFTITEHNFFPENIKVEGTIKNIKSEDVNCTADNLTEILQKANWETSSDNKDVHTFTYDGYVDGIYDLKISYKNVVGTYESSVEPDTFTIDHSKPTNVKFEYKKSLADAILENLTLGFYNPQVTVTLTSYDYYSGVKSFKWNYTQQNGTSNTNRPTDMKETEVAAVQDSADKSKFTATITLPDSEFKQIRGYLSAYAIDNYDNESQKISDNGKVLVVDTVAPSMKVEYSPASRTFGDTAYYNGNIQVTFNVTEANFFAEDVKVKISKNGDVAYSISPVWDDVNSDEHIGTYTLSGDGHYIVSVEYKDRSNNEMKKYVSKLKTIDTVKPKISVDYQNKDDVNTLTDSENHNRKYFDDVQTAKVTVEEHNFNADDVNFSIVGKDVSGEKLDNLGLISQSEWTDNGDTHTMTIKYSGDANYTFDVEYSDLATNKANDYKSDYFTVDKTEPTALTVTYGSSVFETVLENISFGFYNAKTTVTITANDEISKIDSFDYSYIKAANVSDVNAELLDQAIKEAEITYSDDNRMATATFEIPRNVLQTNNQFNGTVEFTAKDRSGNTTNEKGDYRIVVDNISPTATVTYNQPVNEENGISYYDGNINGVITINEANFYSDDVSVTATKDGGASYAVSTSWRNDSNDVHTGSFTLTDDGDYIVTVSYKDKSNNEMNTYTSNQLTIDTKIEKPVITINGNEETGKAYKNKIVPAVSFQDKNFADYDVVLTCTRYGDKDVDVTSKFIGNNITVDNNNGSGSFDTFRNVAENDGIYRLVVKITDKAGHSSDSTVDFTVNRFGSVYEYSDYLTSLIKDGGAYIPSVKDDLIITEYNADKLVKDSLNIEITHDGKPLSNVKCNVSPTLNDKVKVGESGWYQYEYKISKDNFKSDGIYKMSISSKDATGNSPENTNYKDKDILFRVDSSAPEITSVAGLENNIINAQEAPVKYTVYDTIGLKSVQVFVNGKQVGDKITDFSSDMNNYSGNFVIYESNSEQKVRLVVEDLAGNVTDTDSDKFKSAYAFEKTVTVSTNIFVRWYANKILFWCSIVGTVLIIGAVVFILLMKRKTKYDKS